MDKWKVKDWHVIYSESCKNCGKKHELATQPDNRPEYYTKVVIKCDCGNGVSFDLPVN